MTAAPGGAADAASAAFARLALPCLADVARFARSLTRDHARADDLVQETYLQALRGWHTFQEGADPRRWLFSVCRHTFLRTARREARYVEAPADDPELESLATAVAHAAAQGSGAAAALERLDLGPAISEALSALPPHYRVAVVLVDVEGQAYDEAAAVLGVAVGTVRSRLFRGRRLLQDLLYTHAQDAGFAGGRRRTVPPRRAPAPPPRPVPVHEQRPMSGPPTSGPDATHGPGGDADAALPSRAPAPISCETAVRRLWDYLDGGLAAPARGEVEAHLATCAECPPHFAFSGRTLAALAAGRPAAPTPDEDAALRARVRSALGEAR